MTPRTFEDWLRVWLAKGGNELMAGFDKEGRLVFTVAVDGGKPKVFTVKGDRVEPATFDSPSQGGVSNG